MTGRRTRPTRPLPAGWAAPSLADQAAAIAARYAHRRRVELERRLGVRYVGPRVSG